MLTGNKFNEEFAKRRIEESPFHKLTTPSIPVSIEPKPILTVEEIEKTYAEVMTGSNPPIRY